MTTAAAAAEYKSNIDHDFTLADAYNPEYLDADAGEDEDETAARQALNARMAEWYGIG
jgi:hypothetical protein